MFKILIIAALLQLSLGSFERISPLEEFRHVNISFGIQNFLKNNGKKANIKCLAHLVELSTALDKMEFWALQMIDATSKIPTGVFMGNTKDAGNFDECLSIAQNTTSGLIRGKHCISTVDLGASQASVASVTGLPPMWSACVPDSCMAEDVDKYVAQLLETFNINIPMHFNDSYCQTISSGPELNDGDICTIVLFAILGAMLFASTLYDIILFYTEKTPAHPALLAFSVLTNGRKLIAVSSSPSQLLCLNGIRSISMMWILFSHMYSVVVLYGSINPVDALMFLYTPDSMFLLGATVSVDSFFVVGGLVLTYAFLNTLDKGQKFNVLLYYFHRWLRLTPALAAIVLIQVTLLKFFANGPWEMVNQTQVDVCEKWWWSTLLYVQNYVNPTEQCLGVTWYLAVDMQLFILSPLILIPLSKWPKKTLIGLVFLCLCVGAGVFGTVWHFMIVPIGLQATLEQSDANLRYYYNQTHTRAETWLIGIILGYFVYYYKKSKETIKINKILVCILWILSLAILGSCIFTGHNLLTDEYDRWANTIDVTFVRPAWAIALCWVIFACIFGYGGPVDWFLSLPMFQVLSKFTYSMYLLHATVQICVVASMRAPEYFTNFKMFFDFWGFFMITLAMSCVWTLVFESPVMVLEKYLLALGKKQKSSENVVEKKIEEADEKNKISVVVQ